MIQRRRGSSERTGKGAPSAAHRYQLASGPRDLKMLPRPVLVQLHTQRLLSSGQTSPFTSAHTTRDAVARSSLLCFARMSPLYILVFSSFLEEVLFFVIQKQ